MAGLSGAIEIIGRGTSSNAAADAIGSFGGSTLDKLNTSSLQWERLILFIIRPTTRYIVMRIDESH